MGALFDVKLTILHDLSILYSTWLLQKEVVMIKVLQKMIINTETTPNNYEVWAYLVSYENLYADTQDWIAFGILNFRFRFLIILLFFFNTKYEFSIFL